MTDKPKQDELDLAIKEKLIALLLMNQRDPDGIDEYVEYCLRDLNVVVNRQVLAALAEVKSKKKVCDTFHSFGITKRIEAVPLSAVEEIEERYKLEHP